MPQANPSHLFPPGASAGSLRQGQVSSRPPKNHSQAHGGVQPLTPFAQGSQKFQPLPNPIGPPPYHFDLETVIPGIGAKAKAAGKIVFHTVGDTGGIKNPDYQTEVAKAMKGDLNKTDGTAPNFFYHLGDVIYYNGQVSEYYSQFYEPYNHYDVPIVAIPGNHDGDPIDTTQTSLDGWVRFFMTPTPHINPESHDAPRVTMAQPNVYFTLTCPYANIVGMYTNVPEHGSIDSVQQQWLTNEFATAPTDKALILALHHPVYSFDDHHAGSPRMADAVQHAINDSRRVPNMILTAHVHNYQRIERNLVKGVQTPFLVSGNGGYFHLHGMNISPAPAAGARGRHAVHVDPVTSANLVHYNMTNHGYVTLTVDAKNISGVVTSVDETRHPGNPAEDTFSYSVKPVMLPAGVTVSL